MLDVVSAALRVNGVSHLALTGSARQRAALIQQFKTDPDVQVRTAIARFVHFFLSYFLHAC
jgi:SNF2 family DNA or RNA helicase